MSQDLISFQVFSVQHVFPWRYNYVNVYVQAYGNILVRMALHVQPISMKNVQGRNIITVSGADLMPGLPADSATVIFSGTGTCIQVVGCR